MFPRLQRLIRRLSHPAADASRWRHAWASHFRVVLWVARWEIYDSIKLHAQALTYDTLLALVPGVAVIMAMIKGFGGMGELADRLQDIILRNLAGSPDMQQAVVGPLHEFVLRVEAGRMGVVSILLLIFSVLSLLSHIEFAFNAIFGSKHQRPLVTRLVVYWSLLTLGPMLLGASFAITAAFGSTEAGQLLQTDFQWWLVHAVPLVITWVSFAALYLLVPITQVNLSAALPAAVLTGSLWHMAKYFYAIYAKNAFTVQNIYGSLATIPLFILWLYVSWLLVLFGAQLAFALQHAATAHEDERHPPHHAARELAVCRIFLAVATDFVLRRPPTQRVAMAHHLGLPMRLVEDLVAIMCRRGFLRETDPDRDLIPGRDLEQVTVADLLDSVRHVGSSPQPSQDAASEFLKGLLGELDALRRKHAGTIHFRDLARQYGASAAPVAKRTKR